MEEDIIKIAENLGYIVGKYGGEKEAKLLNGLVVDCQNKANTIEKLKKENKEQEKMIELMAQKVNHYVLLEDGINTRPASTEEKIEYFRRKAKGE